MSAGDGPGKGKKTQTEGGLSVANGSGIGIRKNGDGQLESYNTNYRSPDSRFVDPFAAIIFYLYGVDLTGEFSSNRIMLSDGSSVLASGPTFLPGSGGAAKTGVQLALGTTRMRLLNNVSNPQLKKMIEFLYRDGAKFGNGSTGSMIREELANATITSASGSHLTKAQGALNSMRALLKGNHRALSAGDRKIVFEIIEDLTTGTGLKW